MIQIPESFNKGLRMRIDSHMSVSKHPVVTMAVLCSNHSGLCQMHLQPNGEVSFTAWPVNGGRSAKKIRSLLPGAGHGC